MESIRNESEPLLVYVHTQSTTKGRPPNRYRQTRIIAEVEPGTATTLSKRSGHSYQLVAWSDLPASNTRTERHNSEPSHCQRLTESRRHPLSVEGLILLDNPSLFRLIALHHVIVGRESL